MNLRTLLLAAALAAASLPALAAGRTVLDPDLPRSLPAQGPVDVRWTDPAAFTELRHSGNRFEARRGTWVVDLAGHLRRAAERRLPAGERLEIEITDIRRAGNYEPWRGIQYDHVRFLTHLYPPRMTMRVRRLGSDGAVIDDGEVALSDAAYLMGPGSGFDNDPLRFEKHMIDRWAQRTLGPRISAVRPAP
jgi:hypothetical protein